MFPFIGTFIFYELILAEVLRFCQAIDNWWALMNITFAQADPINVQKVVEFEKDFFTEPANTENKKRKG